MGGGFTKAFKKAFLGHRDVKILIVGLDGAGKSSMLHHIKFGVNGYCNPTHGLDIETIMYKNITFISWDFSGDHQSRAMISNYFDSTDAIIYVVDSSDKSRISTNRYELWETFIKSHKLLPCPLLVLANKQDLPTAISGAEVFEKLKLHEINDRPFFIQPTCSVSGDGLLEGIEWLHSELMKKDTCSTKQHHYEGIFDNQTLLQTVTS